MILRVLNRSGMKLERHSNLKDFFSCRGGGARDTCDFENCDLVKEGRGLEYCRNGYLHQGRHGKLSLD